MTYGFLYRKNNNEQPCCWKAELIEDKIVVSYGIINKTFRTESYKVTMKSPVKELESRYAEKRKQGYLSIEDIKDDKYSMTDINNNLYNYLSTYLPSYRNNTNNGNILPMLAKSYGAKIWNKFSCLYGQWKINGLRCLITAYRSNDIFNSVRLKFQSREGIVWNSLQTLEDYLLNTLDSNFIQAMIDESWCLDGEVYLPGCTVNEINHIVKDPNDARNKLIQFWCYDLAIMDMLQEDRFLILYNQLDKFRVSFNNKNEHLNNTNRLILLPVEEITNDAQATSHRNKYIELGFEGLILRNPKAEYSYGQRKTNVMQKYKDKTDGKFVIIDIYKENKRDLPIILCRNDINDAIFETRITDTFENQKYVLDNKEKFIGKKVFVIFGERSGVEQLPFHITQVYVLND